jgi:pimeloyl-ACP methyl ester carboxylesterase
MGKKYPCEKMFSIPEGYQHLSAVLHDCGHKDNLVVMAHGFTSHKMESARLFVTAARAFAKKGINILRFDFIGSGDSSGGFNEMSPNTEIADLLFILRWARQRFQRIGLIGMSLGGAVSICASAKAPQGVPAFLVTWSAVPRFSDWRSRPDSVDEQNYCTPNWVGPQFYSDRPSQDVPEAYCSLAIPKLQIQGDQDLPGFREKFLEYYPSALEPKEHLVIPGADHSFSRWEHRKRLLSETFNWMEKYLSKDP